MVLGKSVSLSVIWWLSSSNIYHLLQLKMLLMTPRSPSPLELKTLGSPHHFATPTGKTGRIWPWKM